MPEWFLQLNYILLWYSVSFCCSRILLDIRHPQRSRIIYHFKSLFSFPDPSRIASHLWKTFRSHEDSMISPLFTASCKFLNWSCPTPSTSQEGDKTKVATRQSQRFEHLTRALLTKLGSHISSLCVITTGQEVAIQRFKGSARLVKWILHVMRCLNDLIECHCCKGVTRSRLKTIRQLHALSEWNCMFFVPCCWGMTDRHMASDSCCILKAAPAAVFHAWCGTCVAGAGCSVKRSVHLRVVLCFQHSLIRRSKKHQMHFIFV